MSPSIGPIHIVVDTTLHFSNMGDLAMLRVCMKRLKALWPNAQIRVFTSDPEGLAAQFPPAEPILAAARAAWLDDGFSTDPLGQRMRFSFLGAIHSADLFVLAGMGGLTDAFEAGALQILRTARFARSIGVPLVAFSQGIGPIRRGTPLWEEARRSLPLFDLIAVREGRSGPALLSELGVAAEKIVVTGDDAVELAYGTGARPGAVIGVGVRAAGYSGWDDAATRSLGARLKQIAADLGAGLAPIAISHVESESDLRTYDEMFGVEPGSTACLDPEEWIRRTGRCRVVVAGCYHAAVFALSQGIPAVCVAASPYYSDKFLGLADQFGAGCEVLQAGDGVEGVPLAPVVSRLWDDAPRLRTSLLAAAKRQVEAGQAACARVRMMAGPAERRLAETPHLAGIAAEWQGEKIRALESELAATIAYLQKVEEARDWHRDRAEQATSQLQDMRRSSDRQSILARIRAAARSIRRPK